jgi:hypothetical protein
MELKIVSVGFFFQYAIKFYFNKYYEMQYHCWMTEHSVGEDMVINAGSNFLPVLINY